MLAARARAGGACESRGTGEIQGLGFGVQGLARRRRVRASRNLGDSGFGVWGLGFSTQAVGASLAELGN